MTLGGRRWQAVALCSSCHYRLSANRNNSSELKRNATNSLAYSVVRTVRLERRREMADLTVNQGATTGRTHAGWVSDFGNVAPGKPVIRRSDNDDEKKAYHLLWLRAKRVLTSGTAPEDMTETQIAVVSEWMNSPETSRLADAGDAEIVAALTGAVLV